MMLASRLIELLRESIEEHGDLRVKNWQYNEVFDIYVVMDMNDGVRRLPVVPVRLRGKDVDKYFIIA